MRELGPGWYFLAMAVIPLPLAWFTIPAGEVYAAQLTTIGVIGAALAAVALQLTLSYGVARYAFGPALGGLLKGKGFTVPKVTPENALSVALLVRLTPGPPMILGSCALAIAEVPFRLYLLVSWLVTVPWVVGGVVMGKGVLSGNLKMAAAGAAVLAIAVIVVQSVRRKRAGAAVGANETVSADEVVRSEEVAGAGGEPRRDAGYVYKCVDESWLSDQIGAKVAPAVERALFRAWSANTVTWVGSGLMWFMLAGVILCPAGLRESAGMVWAGLLWVYCVLDHVDGKRARLRGTSGPWGEFLDHGLDAWNGSIMLLVMAVVGGGAVDPLVTAITLACAGLATVATWADQRWRGEIFLGKAGPVEAVALGGLFLASWSFPRAAEGWSAVPFEGGFTWAEIFFGVGAVGSLVSAAGSWRRAPAMGWTAGWFAAKAGALVVAGGWGLPWWAVWAGLALMTADAAVGMLVCHLSKGRGMKTDSIGSGLLLGALVWPLTEDGLIAAGLVWSAARAAYVWRDAARRYAPQKSL